MTLVGYISTVNGSPVQVSTHEQDFYKSAQFTLKYRDTWVVGIYTGRQVDRDKARQRWKDKEVRMTTELQNGNIRHNLVFEDTDPCVRKGVKVITVFVLRSS